MILIGEEFIEIKKTKNKGKGIFAKKKISKGSVVGDYIGLVMRPEEVEIDEENFYLMYYHDHAVISPDLNKPGVHFLNNSCKPNLWLFIYKGHILAFSLREVPVGEELTIPYLLPPITTFCNPCPHVCLCGYVNCTGTMHLSSEKYKKWREINEKQSKETKRERIRYGKDLRPLKEYPKTIPESYILEIYKLIGVPRSS